MKEVTITVNASEVLGKLERIWCSFGYDEINWTYTPTGKEIFRQIRDLDDGPFFIRNHNAFTSGNRLSRDYWASTNCYTEDNQGKPRYDWSTNDRIYDTYLEFNCRPMIELDFMPHDLSSRKDLGPEKSWAYAPRDYKQWQELNFNFARHLIDRYGKTEVRSWYFSPWNEPDIHYFRHTPNRNDSNETPSEKIERYEEYCKLYDFAAAGILAADSQLRFGGPEVANRTDFLEHFLTHCQSGTNYVTEKKGSRLDFISFHSKATAFNNGRVPNPDFDKTARRDFMRYFSIIRKFRKFLHLPLLGNEWDIDVGTPFGIYDSPDFTYRNTSYYPTYFIRSIKELLDLKREKGINIELVTQWAFYFEGKRCFEGTRSLFDPMGIRKPVFNGFEFLARLGAERLLAVTDDEEHDIAPGETAGWKNNSTCPRETGEDEEISEWDRIMPHPRVDALAARDHDEIQILIWHQMYDIYAHGNCHVKIIANNLGDWKKVRISHFRIDDTYSNVHTIWTQLGSPDWPTQTQIAFMKEREGTQKFHPDKVDKPENGQLTISFDLPVHGVSLLILRNNVLK